MGEPIDKDGDRGEGGDGIELTLADLGEETEEEGVDAGAGATGSREHRGEVVVVG
jgi:hypothetical protein